MEREGEVRRLKSNRDTREIAFVMKEDTCEMNFMMNYISKAVTREEKKNKTRGNRFQMESFHILEMMYLLHTSLGDML